MNKFITAIHTALLASLLLSTAAFGAVREAPLVVNHLCTVLDTIPLEAIQTAQDLCKWHYARTSHGRQLMVGFDRIESVDPFYAAIWPGVGGSLPVEPGMLCIYTDAVGPESYWRGSGIDVTRSIITGTPALNISAMCWCTELNTATESYVQDYLTAMQTLENEFPDVAFVYFTGTAENNGAYGNNRYLRNKQIRDFCVANNKILYDFEDLDCWWFNPATQQWDYSTYEYNGATVPVEHPNLAGDDAEHTSYESCEQKGSTAWWLMSMLAGWSGTPVVSGDNSDGPAPTLGLSSYPNPFNPSTTIVFSLPSQAHTRIEIYDTAGRLGRTLVDEVLAGGPHQVLWDGRDKSGCRLNSGVYLYRITAGNVSTSRKIVLLR